MSKPRIGIVLSGGGARGFAHIGVLKALNEHGIFPDEISAVSAGSIVGALYADGYTPDEIFNCLYEVHLLNILRIKKPSFGILNTDGLRKLLGKHLRHQTIETLNTKLYISATNFTKAHSVYFDKGPLIDAIIASSAIPLILKPVIIDGDMYVDGGLMNNLPVEPLLMRCQKIIGVNVNPVHEVDRFTSFRNYADRVMHLAIRANVQNNIPKCDIYIEPPMLKEYNWFKVSSAKDITESGYKYTQKVLSEHRF